MDTDSQTTADSTKPKFVTRNAMIDVAVSIWASALAETRTTDVYAAAKGMAAISLAKGSRYMQLES